MAHVAGTARLDKNPSKLIWTGAVLALAVLVPWAVTSVWAGCPDTSLGESPEDCPWSKIARDMQAAAAKHGDVLKVLQREHPLLYSQIHSDLGRQDWMDLWGNAINFDELAKGVVVAPEIIDELMKMVASSSKRSEHAIVQAGIQHTYGYLFSTLKTSFGYKRARWVRDTLDRGFGLPIGTLSPLPKSGTLFSNATYFAGRIAFRDEPAALKILAQGNHDVSPSLTSFHFESLKPIRLEETIRTESGDVILRTDLVPFVNKVDGQGNTHWLVYSVADRRNLGKGASATSKLITAFPVDSPFVETVMNPENLGEDKPIVTRYNAYVDAITGAPHSGSRHKL